MQSARLVTNLIVTGLAIHGRCGTTATLGCRHLCLTIELLAQLPVTLAMTPTFCAASSTSFGAIVAYPSVLMAESKRYSY